MLNSHTINSENNRQILVARDEQTGFDRYLTDGNISDFPKKSLLIKKHLIDKLSSINDKNARNLKRNS